jgi:hypothetical protein
MDIMIFGKVTLKGGTNLFLRSNDASTRGTIIYKWLNSMPFNGRTFDLVFRLSSNSKRDYNVKRVEMGDNPRGYTTVKPKGQKAGGNKLFFILLPIDDDPNNTDIEMGTDDENDTEDEDEDNDNYLASKHSSLKKRIVGQSSDYVRVTRSMSKRR